jgi:hypothetical protein
MGAERSLIVANDNSTALTQRVDDTVRNVSALSSETFEVAQRMAKALASSSIVPAEYRGNIANVMVAMEYAHRLGASVLAVMQNLDVINGRPSLRSTFLIGTVNACGRFTPLRPRWEGKQGTDEWGCRAVATDRESGEECVGPLVTIGIAKLEGWHGRKGSKWITLPELMLTYRAAAFWTRVFAPELSLGLHTTDELEDVGPPPAQRARLAAKLLDAPDIPSIPPAELAPAVLEAVTFAKGLDPRGNDATVKQREGIKRRVVELFGSESDELPWFKELADNPKLGTGQAGALIGRLDEALQPSLTATSRVPGEDDEPDDAA